MKQQQEIVEATERVEKRKKREAEERKRQRLSVSGKQGNTDFKAFKNKT